MTEDVVVAEETSCILRGNWGLFNALRLYSGRPLIFEFPTVIQISPSSAQLRSSPLVKHSIIVMEKKSTIDK